MKDVTRGIGEDSSSSGGGGERRLLRDGVDGEE